MGKKKGGRNRRSSSNANAVTDAGAGAAALPDTKPAATATVAFVLRVPTHCGCDGCGGRLRSGVRDLTLRCDGVVSLDTSALATKGELAVVATADVDPERFRRRLSKRTGKTVDLVFPATNKPAKPADKDEDAADDTAAAVQALLAGLQLGAGAHGLHRGELAVPAAYAWNALRQQQHGGGGGGGGYGYGQAAAAAYPWPWVVQQQQLQAAAPETEPEPYLLSYPAVPSWGAYPHGGGWLGY